MFFEFNTLETGTFLRRAVVPAISRLMVAVLKM